MNHTSYVNAACDLICRIRDFPIEKLREEIDTKRKHLLALGWPEPDESLGKQLNEYIGSAQALRYQIFDAGSPRSGRRSPNEAER